MRAVRGFTLIELLIVVVVLGILASLAVLDYSRVKHQSYVTQMKADLRNLETAEEAFFYDSSAYTTNFSAMNNYAPTAGVTVTVNEATGQGWSATASSIRTTTKCYVFAGSATPVGAATAEGEIACS